MDRNRPTVVTAQVEGPLKHKLRVAAAEEGISMSEYIRRLVERELFFDPEVQKNDSDSNEMEHVA